MREHSRAAPRPVENAQLVEIVRSALTRLWTYLQTWQGTDGQFAGLIATWWSSTVDTAVPHPMNQVPILLGLLRLHDAGITGDQWLARAERVGNGLAGSMGEDGVFKNAWGDIPGRRTGPIFHTSALRAFCELYVRTGNQHYLDAAQRLDRLVAGRWASRDQLRGSLVVNQCLSWAWSKLHLGHATADMGLVHQAGRIARQELRHQIQDGLLAGAFHQGRFDDRVITVYVGKCLDPLHEIGTALSDDLLCAAASQAADYIFRQGVPAGLWANCYLPSGISYSALRTLSRIDRRILRLTLPVYRPRRALAVWHRVDYPSWIARSADTLRALWHLCDAGLASCEAVLTCTKVLLATQHPSGGFPNTVGFFGSPEFRAWQDVVPITRWNAYAFLLLAELAVRWGVRNLEPGPLSATEWSMELDNGETVVESVAAIELRQHGGLRWRILKPTGTTQVQDPRSRGDLSGPRG